MANEQLALYDVPPEPPKQTDNQKRKWENGFQRWSNESAQDERNPLGVCGYGSMCDYCEDNTYGRPCVRALNEMCREKRITIDYSKRNYDEIWDGVSWPTAADERSRREEQADPCENCLRWYECNGVDEACPWRKKE